jgi:hypothetical protein
LGRETRQFSNVELRSTNCELKEEERGSMGEKNIRVIDGRAVSLGEKEVWARRTLTRVTLNR